MKNEIMEWLNKNGYKVVENKIFNNNFYIFSLNFEDNVKIYREKILESESSQNEDFLKFWRYRITKREFNKKEEIFDLLKEISIIFFQKNITEFYIKKMRMENYRKYQDITFNFKKQFTLLVGENAKGKTTVLDGIATSIGAFLTGFDEIAASNTHPIKKSDIRYEISEEFENVFKKYYNPTIISGEYFINESKLNWARSLAGEKDSKVGKKDNYTAVYLAKELKKQIGKESLMPVFAYHGTGRIWKEQKETSRNQEQLSKIDSYVDCLQPSSSFKNFIKWFEKMDYNSYKIKKDIPIFETLKATIKEAFEKLCDLKIEAIRYRENDIEIVFVDKKILPVSQMSDGYKNILSLVSDIAYRIAVANPQIQNESSKKISGIVLIDEIDLHLHPKWQKKIVHMLKEVFPKVQFIATTHSPFIIQSMERDEIINLSNEILDENKNPLMINGTEKSIEDVTEEIMGIEMPQWSKRREDMFNAAKEYYEVLDKLETGESTKEEVEKMKAKLDELSKPFSDNPAFTAFLERKRMIAERGK